MEKKLRKTENVKHSLASSSFTSREKRLNKATDEKKQICFTTHKLFLNNQTTDSMSPVWLSWVLDGILNDKCLFSSSWLDQMVQAKDDQRKLKPHNHDLSGKIKEPMMNLLKMGRCRD